MSAEHTARALLGRAAPRTFHLPERRVTLAALEAGHLVPMERPDLVVDAVERLMT